MARLPTARTPARPVLGGLLLASAGLLATACGGGSAPATSFHPSGGPSSRAAPSAPASAPAASQTSVIMPPYGSNVHIEMSSYAPKSAQQAPAVIAAKNFLLALFYADYTAGQDPRWKAYVSSAAVRASISKSEAAGSIPESFTGTIRFWKMNSFLAGHGSSAKVEVTECVDSSKATSINRDTGQVLPAADQLTRDQNLYSNTDVLARNASGQWRVTAVLPTLYYPQALECKP